MEFPKLVYDDFYKFLMSLGIILFTISLGLGIFIVNSLILSYQWIFIILCILAFVFSICIMVCAGKKWYKNQTYIDAKIKADSDIAAHTARTIMLTSKDRIYAEDYTEEGIEKEGKKRSGVALVSYRIASILPNSVLFNFSKDYKAWFLIANHEFKKYRAYVKIEYIAEGGLKKEITSGHYGGTQAWNLNALSAIQAPGIVAPDEIKNALNQGKRIKVIINCKIYNERDEFIEEKLPQTYVYDSDNNNWFLEP